MSLGGGSLEEYLNRRFFFFSFQLKYRARGGGLCFAIASAKQHQKRLSHTPRTGGVINYQRANAVYLLLDELGNNRATLIPTGNECHKSLYGCITKPTTTMNRPVRFDFCLGYLAGAD